MIPDAILAPAAKPASLRDGIENAAIICSQIGSTLSLLSRSQEIEGDMANALAALATLLAHTADRIDALIDIRPEA